MMDDERKLASAFIYAGYDAEKCGDFLGDKRKEYANIYQNFISGERGDLPKHMGIVQHRFSKLLKRNNLREHIYNFHFDDLIGTPGLGVLSSMHQDVKDCATHFYEVIEVSDSRIKGRDLFSDDEKELRILNGLEKVSVGNVVSGHWNHFLERVDDLPDFERYKEIAKDYFTKLGAMSDAA